VVVAVVGAIGSEVTSGCARIFGRMFSTTSMAAVAAVVVGTAVLFVIIERRLRRVVIVVVAVITIATTTEIGTNGHILTRTAIVLLTAFIFISCRRCCRPLVAGLLFRWRSL